MTRIRLICRVTCVLAAATLFTGCHAVDPVIRPILVLFDAGQFKPTSQHRIVPRGSTLELVWNDGDFTEGPAAHPSTGHILFSDIGNRILEFNPATKSTTVFRDPSHRSNGLFFDGAGRLYAAEGANTDGGRRITRTDVDGSYRTLTDNWQGKRFNSPNDLAVDAQGRVYFTDPRYVGDEPRDIDFEGVFLVHPDGRTVVATREVEKPNGILVSPDGSTVYVADNNPAKNGALQLAAFSVLPDGRLSGKRVLYTFSPDQRGIDGMTFDAIGNIYATAGKGDLAGIYVFSPQGEHLAHIKTPGDPTNCVFGRFKESSVLYITAEGPKPADSPGSATARRYALYRIRLSVPGYHLATP